MKARIGKLRHRLSLEAASRTEDGGGGAISSWTEVVRLWGAVEAVSGREAIAADRVSGHVDDLVTIRYREGVTPGMRFRRGPQLFHITAVMDKDGRKRFLACECRRRDL